VAQRAAATAGGAGFRLGKFFDYIGGTSTGAIIAAGVALGQTVDELIKFYRDAGRQAFKKEVLLSRLTGVYTADLLRDWLRAGAWRAVVRGSRNYHACCCLSPTTQAPTQHGPSLAIRLPNTMPMIEPIAICRYCSGNGGGPAQRRQCIFLQRYRGRETSLRQGGHAHTPRDARRVGRVFALTMLDGSHHRYARVRISDGTSRGLQLPAQG